MSAPKLLDRLHARQAELVELERRSKNTPPPTSTDRQTERIRRLAQWVTPAELLAAYATVRPTLKRELSAGDLHELALTLCLAAKKTELDIYRPAREVCLRDIYEPTQRRNNASRTD